MNIQADTRFSTSERLAFYHARKLANFLHAKQTYGDEDYIYHVDQVVDTLVFWGTTELNIIIAAYLHDVVEDTQATFALIEEYFGTFVRNTVEAVTNESGLNRKERNLKTYLKLKDNEDAILVKLADRIANMEHSKKMRTRFYQMYADEYPGFRYALYNPEHKRARGMWGHLDKLVQKDVDIN